MFYINLPKKVLEREASNNVVPRFNLKINKPIQGYPEILICSIV